MATLADGAATRRLLDRFGFGPLPGELDAAQARGFAATLAEVLGPATAPDPGVVATPPPDLGPVPRVDRRDVTAAADAKHARADGQQELTAWWLDRMSAARRALPERLTWFWHGHFATSAQKVNQPAYLLAQNETQRRLGAGDFGALAHAMIVDPAMLVWLDGRSNRVGAPNENLAREFMELFALGVGHYTENDVREAARALTGWTVDPAGAARLVATRQDTGPKTVLGTTGPLDAAGFVDLVLDREPSARFVAGRVWSRLVSTTAPAPPGLVAAYGTGRDVTALLRAIATSAPFHDATTTLVKQPVEWAVGLMRAVGARASAVPGTAQRLTPLGQVPFRPPSVGGWPAGTAWLTPSAGLSRLALAREVIAKGTIERGPAGAAAQLEWARRVLGVDAWSPRSTAALQKAAGDPGTVLAVAALTPEYVVST